VSSSNPTEELTLQLEKEIEMRKSVLVSTLVWTVMSFGAVVCQAEKWDKNSFADEKIEAGYYNADSIKTKGSTVSWTEKFILRNDAAAALTSEISKHQVCRQNIEKKGAVALYQMDFQVEKDKFRGVSKRYYNKANKLICSDKDTGEDIKAAWTPIQRRSPMQQAQYDLVTKYKVKFQ
jgi:hypothetical protein